MKRGVPPWLRDHTHTLIHAQSVKTNHGALTSVFSLSLSHIPPNRTLSGGVRHMLCQVHDAVACIRITDAQRLEQLARPRAAFAREARVKVEQL